MNTRHVPSVRRNGKSSGRKAAPAFERASTSFGPLDADRDDPWRHRRRRPSGARALLVAAVATLGLGAAVTVQLADLWLAR